MTDFYIRLGTDPQPLPFEAYDETGRIWTDLSGSLEGRKATGWNKLAPATPPFDPATQRVIWAIDQWVVVEIPAGEPTIEAERDPYLYAAAQFSVVNEEIFSVGMNSRFSGAFVLGTGQYFVMFYEPLPDTEYMAMATAIGPYSAYVFPADKTPEGFTVTVTDAVGSPADVQAVNISIVRH